MTTPGASSPHRGLGREQPSSSYPFLGGAILTWHAVGSAALLPGRLEATQRQLAPRPRHPTPPPTSTRATDLNRSTDLYTIFYDKGILFFRPARVDPVNRAAGRVAGSGRSRSRTCSAHRA